MECCHLSEFGPRLRSSTFACAEPTRARDLLRDQRYGKSTYGIWNYCYVRPRLSLAYVLLRTTVGESLATKVAAKATWLRERRLFRSMEARLIAQPRLPSMRLRHFLKGEPHGRIHRETHQRCQT